MTYLTAAQVRERFKISDPTLYRWTRDPGLKFPQPLKIKRRKLFDEAKLNEWERSRSGEAA
ncbi:helix-turn-helix domain-containing protein [Neorhizobium sp. CSC1952]|uniref:helix-turn-helix transcriptional regulator n=1 Tax=Neorhizobium sp. CSC1952 TaxID=2978974 RepID=UPI0025A5960F|nr:helix-turn-helix domain-containing protein [Rhizobium sp. CSC1952]WJR67254.1 helix-turn-helix domain-containing protein [Rhizobium sp. CSC1952]